MRILSIIIGLALTAFSAGHGLSEGGKSPAGRVEDLGKSRLKAAQEAYRLYVEEGESRTQFHMRMELRYLWSKRILDAQLDLASEKKLRIAAYQGHFDRIAELEKAATKDAAVRRATAAQVAATEYYRKEAQYWLAKARQATK